MNEIEIIREETHPVIKYLNSATLTKNMNVRQSIERHRKKKIVVVFILFGLSRKKIKLRPESRIGVK